jgi:heterodisulfide reductase subunit A-like polyferredoxin
MFPGLEVVAVDEEKCTSCGRCVERCHFGANSLNGSGLVDLAKCYGCGLCVSTCAGEARQMVKREHYHNRFYPVELVRNASAS